MSNDALSTIVFLVKIPALIVHFSLEIFCDDFCFDYCFYAPGQAQILLVPALALSCTSHVEISNFLDVKNLEVDIRCNLTSFKFMSTSRHDNIKLFLLNVDPKGSNWFVRLVR